MLSKIYSQTGNTTNRQNRRGDPPAGLFYFRPVFQVFRHRHRIGNGIANPNGMQGLLLAVTLGRYGRKKNFRQSGVLLPDGFEDLHTKEDIIKALVTLKSKDPLLRKAVVKMNDGFSGGEKKRAEILQMAMLKPSMAILDETDSGLDIDALRIVSEGVNTLHDQDPNMGVLVITHYQRLLNYIKPQFVHVLIGGRIVESGGPELALELESRGYDWLREEA